MAKPLSTLIRENTEMVKDLHGTPYLILHDRKSLVNEEVQSDWYKLMTYQNQNRHISGNVDETEHINKTHEILSSLHPRSSFSDLEHKHVFEHTVESKPTNASLWNRHNDIRWAASLPKHVPILDTALGKFKVPSGGLTTFSGLQSDPSEAAKKHPENKLFLPAYTSTSISPAAAGSFAEKLKGEDGNQVRHIMKFKFPEGMNAGAYVAGHAHHPTEYEFLTRRGMSVHLHPEPEIIPYQRQNGKPVSGKIHIWTAHPLGFHEK